MTKEKEEEPVRTTACMSWEMLCFAAVALKGSEEGCKYLHFWHFSQKLLQRIL